MHRFHPVIIDITIPVYGVIKLYLLYMYSEKEHVYICCLQFALRTEKRHMESLCFGCLLRLAWLQPRIWNRRATPRKVGEQCGETQRNDSPKRPRSLPVALVAKCGAWFCAPLPKSALVFCSALGSKMVKADPFGVLTIDSWRRWIFFLSFSSGYEHLQKKVDPSARRCIFCGKFCKAYLCWLQEFQINSKETH